MKRFKLIILASGWLFLALFVLGKNYISHFMPNFNAIEESTISWEEHLQFFKGAVQCNLLEEELQDRKTMLKEDVFAKVIKRKETPNSITYYFEDEASLLESVFEHVQIEKACCPFLKFDFSILPFGKGFALMLSGSEEAIEMLKEYEARAI